MTEKRYYRMNDMEINDKLNELNEKVKKLSDENEQLKKDLKKQFVPFVKADENGITKVDTNTFIEILQENEQLKEENERLKQENKKLHSKIFEMRTNEALERTEISKQSYDGYKTKKEFFKELEKW